MAALSARRLAKEYSSRGLFILPIFLAFTTTTFFFLHLSFNSKLNIHQGLTTRVLNPTVECSKTDPPVHRRAIVDRSVQKGISQEPDQFLEKIMMIKNNISNLNVGNNIQEHGEVLNEIEGPLPQEGTPSYDNNKNKNHDIFHNRDLFMNQYNQMNKSLKIYTYPHTKTDPFANVLLPSNHEPGGNYASESYFKQSLFKSHFLTNDPSEADLFYLPFSIASLRHDKRVGVDGIKDFVRDYVLNISRTYPFWNRTGGADHFYVACHSVGRSAMEKVVEVKLNAIQVVCSSSYFLAGYVAHKDASVPQIWPRKGKPPTRLPSQRKVLAFYAGAMNSKVRQLLVQTWKNDSEISVHSSRLKTPYSESHLTSKFCIHAKGFEVNTARIGDALYYGCVPVVLADHYDLPFADLLNWNSFAVILSTDDIPNLKRILKEMILSNEYLKLQSNVMRVQRHFQWHNLPIDFDAFHMVMKELWIRRSRVRLLFD